MPRGKGYVSEAQRRALHALAARGEIDPASVERRDREYRRLRARGGRLPERARSRR